MKILFYLSFLTLIASCGDDTPTATAPAVESSKPQYTFDLTLTTGATTLGVGPNYSSDQAVLDCSASPIAKLMNLSNKVAFGVNSTVSCGSCDVTVGCTPGETVNVEAVIWNNGQPGGQIGLVSGQCNSLGKFVATDKYTGGYPLRITATMGSSTDVEYVQCADPGIQ